MCFIGEEACFFKKAAKDKEKTSFAKATDPAEIINLVEFLLAFGGAAVCALEEEPNRVRICLTGGVVGRAVGAMIGIIYYDGFKDTSLPPRDREKKKKTDMHRANRILAVLFLEFLFVSGFLLPEKGCF